MHDIRINVLGQNVIVTIENVTPPTDPPRCSDPDQAAFDHPGDLGSFDIVCAAYEATGRVYNMDLAEDEEVVYEAVEDALHQLEWKVE